MCVGNIDVTDREVKLDHKKLRKEFTLELTDTERELPLVVLSTKRNGETSLGFGNSALLAEFSQAFQNETGFELALKEGSQTKKNGKMMDKRSVEFDGKEYGMQMHVKGRNPKIGFRLYCEPDKERGIIVIGHCGRHLETAGTARRAVNK